jgi:hypothetical protein
VDERLRQTLCGVGSGIAATIVYTGTSAQLRKLGAAPDSVQPIQVAKALAGGTDARRGDSGHRGLANGLLHWGYGIWGGVLRAALVRRGMTGMRADLVQLAVFWLPWRLLAMAHRPAHRVSRPARGIALSADLFKHLAYVVTSRLVYDRLARRR